MARPLSDAVGPGAASGNSGLLLRPMTVAQILDRALEVYRQHFVPLFVLAVIAWGMFAFCLLGWLYYIHFQREIWGSPRYIVGALPWVAAFLASFYGLFALQAHQIDTSYQAVRGSPQSLLVGARWCWRRLGTICLVWSIVLSTTFVGGVLYLLPGVFAWAWLSMALAVAAIERDQHFFHVFVRANTLRRGTLSKWLRFFMLFRLLELLGLLNLWLLRMIIIYLGRVLFSVDLSFAQRIPYGGLMLFVLVLLVLQPLKSAVISLLYVDARVRSEGWDLHLRVEALAAAQEEAAKTSALGPSTERFVPIPEDAAKATS